MTTKKTAALFSAIVLVPVLLAGCLQVEQPLAVDETSRLLVGADFREYYCAGRRPSQVAAGRFLHGRS